MRRHCFTVCVITSHMAANRRVCARFSGRCTTAERRLTTYMFAVRAGRIDLRIPRQGWGYVVRMGSEVDRAHWVQKYYTSKIGHIAFGLDHGSLRAVWATRVYSRLLNNACGPGCRSRVGRIPIVHRPETGLKHVGAGGRAVYKIGFGIRARGPKVCRFSA